MNFSFELIRDDTESTFLLFMNLEKVVPYPDYSEA